MAAITFDIVNYIKQLKEAGFTDQQVEVQASAMQHVIENNIATKQDINDLKSLLKEMESRIVIRLGSMMIAAVAFLTAIKFFG